MAAKQVSKKKQLEEEQMRLKKIDDSTDQPEYEYVVVPPDGGFGWVVAIAAMVCLDIFSRFKQSMVLPLSFDSSCAILSAMVRCSLSVQ